jgi:D-lactate dehydrogenase (cytochrome)
MNVRSHDEEGAIRAESITRRLIDTLGADAVSTDPHERQLFSLDFSEEVGETAVAVVRPKSVEAISALMRLASAEGFAVNTRGGGMSYTKGHVPVRPDTVVLDNTGFNRILEVNTTDRYVSIETGTRWVDLRAALQGTGMRVPYLGTLSGNWATVGGGLSQNATGMGRMTLAEHVLGHFRNRAVLPLQRPRSHWPVSLRLWRIRYQDQGSPAT